MNKQIFGFKKLNRKGYTVMLIVILFIMIVFWRLFFTSREAVSYISLQKGAMNSSQITMENGY